MKCVNLLFLTVLVLFFVDIPAVSAQNSVTVSQQGNGNNVNIRQSNGPANKSIKNGCKEYPLPTTDLQNSMTVTADGSTPDTLIYTAGNPSNMLSAILGKNNTLEARQYGAGNTLSVLLPDSSDTFHRLKTEQRQSGNTITAQFRDTPSRVSVKQDGSRNTVSVNPCTN